MKICHWALSDFFSSTKLNFVERSWRQVKEISASLNRIVFFLLFLALFYVFSWQKQVGWCSQAVVLLCNPQFPLQQYLLINIEIVLQVYVTWIPTSWLVTILIETWVYNYNCALYVLIHFFIASEICSFLFFPSSI